MTGEEILALEKCGDLFPQDEQGVKEKYKMLAKKWHPDSNTSKMAPEVFAKINVLYHRALTCLSEKTWEKTNYLLLTKEDGKHVTLNYDETFSFELGQCYVCRTKVVYVLGKEKEKYYQNTLKQLKALHYPDKNMKTKVGICIPECYGTFKTSLGEYVIVFNKNEEIVPLRTVLDYFDGKMDPRHVAWMISRLSNLACFLKYNGLVHNGMSLNSCFIIPSTHDVVLMGGWWYTTREHEKMIGTTKEIFDVMSVKAKGNKHADTITDLEAIKLLGRQLLGESNSRKLALMDKLPKALIDFLNSGSTEDAYKEFEKWDFALERAFGERRFIPMHIEHLYKK